MRIYLSPPHQSGKEKRYLDEVLQSNFIAPVGPFLDRFEAALKEATGAPDALALSSATAGLHLSLRLLGVGEGDKVAVSNFTFIASLSPILYQNAKPILVDCDESWQIDPELLEEAFKKERPKVLILTHLYGGSADMDAVTTLCERYGVALIEDSAEALGSRFGDRALGTFGRFGVYSFNGNKILTCGGGGVLVGDDEELMHKARKLATQAKEEGYPWYEHTTYGYNYRLSNVLAAIGTAQMEVLEERVKKKRQIFGWYKELLGDIATFMPEHPKAFSNRWLTTLTFSELDPLAVHRKLLKEKIESRPLWKPMDMQPAFKDLSCYTKRQSRRLFERGLCLPSGTQLSKEEVQQICRIVRS
jgi:UDP-N-acetylbacillosamine transaminase